MFFYVYKALAHPEKDGYVQPVTIEERLAHVAAAKAQLDTRMPWLADSMANDLKHAFGDRNNSEFVISADGKIAIARSWSDPATLRADLAEMVGESERVTRPEGLGRKPQAGKRSKVASGIVPRVKRPEGAVALKSKVLLEDGAEAQPLYVKLRAELPGEPLRGRGGGAQLYLGFHLDPIHTVHWNNLAEPLRWEIETPDGVALMSSSGAAAKVEPEADIDPREFLVDLEFDGAVPKEPMVLTVNYFACDDEEGWCRAVTQQYEIAFETDRDAGRVQAGGRRGGGGRDRPGGGRGRGQRPDPAQMVERMDGDGDGKISREEARGQMQQRFDQIDSNGDGAVTKEELEARFSSRR